MTTTPSQRIVRINAPKLLLVEGQDDRRFFSAFIRWLSISNMQVEVYGGTANFGNFLALLVANPQFDNVTSLGIVRDADSSRQSAFDSVAGSLRRANLPVPCGATRPAVAGGISVSVMIIPPGSETGKLENLCLGALGDDDPVLDCADQYLDCVTDAGIRLPDRTKSRLHAYLAAGNEPGRRLGEAADAGIWNWTSPAFAEVADFLRSL